MNSNDLNIILEFGGGADFLFGGEKKRKICLPGCEKWNIRKLIKWMHDNILTERPELFIQGDTVRPGILVLINDTDWELLGELNYELQQNDNIFFISTLHGDWGIQNLQLGLDEERFLLNYRVDPFQRGRNADKRRFFVYLYATSNEDDKILI